MRRRITAIILSLFILLFLTSSVWGLGSDANFKDPEHKEQGQREYSPDKAKLPYDGTNDKGYKGGHDTVTCEAAELKKKVHKDDPDGGGEKFNRWIDQTALKNFRSGAHDEDSVKWPIVGYAKTDPPIGPNGDGDYKQHFDDKGNKIFKEGWMWYDSAIKRAENFAATIDNMLGCKDFCELPKEDQEKLIDWIGRIGHLMADMSSGACFQTGLTGCTGLLPAGRKPTCKMSSPAVRSVIVSPSAKRIYASGRSSGAG